MDIEQLKSEDQIMDIMMMMQNQMNQSPELCGACNDITDFPPSDFSVTNYQFTPNPIQQHQNQNSYSAASEKPESMAAMREMIFRIAAMQPINIDPEAVKAPKRKNVKISKDPQSVAARHRRERISERIRILQRLVPGGTKMDTASMLDEAIHYVKFLKTQVQSLERVAVANNNRTSGAIGVGVGVGFPVGAVSSGIGYVSMGKGCGEVVQTQNFQRW